LSGWRRLRGGATLSVSKGFARAAGTGNVVAEANGRRAVAACR
jgi:hypothetical protein